MFLKQYVTFFFATLINYKGMLFQLYRVQLQIKREIHKILFFLLHLICFILFHAG